MAIMSFSFSLSLSFCTNRPKLRKKAHSQAKCIECETWNEDEIVYIIIIFANCLFDVTVQKMTSRRPVHLVSSIVSHLFCFQSLYLSLDFNCSVPISAFVCLSKWFRCELLSVFGDFKRQKFIYEREAKSILSFIHYSMLSHYYDTQCNVLLDERPNIS